MDIMTVGSLIVAVLVALNSMGMLNLNRKIAEIGSTRIVNNPLGVSIEKHYVTREECAACMRDTKNDLREMKALYDKIVMLVMERDERSVERSRQLNEVLSEKIITMGDQLHTRITESNDEGAERRRRIHDKLNEHADRLAAIHVRTEVSKDIGKLGSAIMALAKKNPDHV
jgi:hypothetical protein